MFAFLKKVAPANQDPSGHGATRQPVLAGERLQGNGWFSWWRSTRPDGAADSPVAPDVWEQRAAAIATVGDETSQLVASLLKDRRYALLLRPEIAASLTAEHCNAACEALDELMSLVPDGTVCLKSRRGELVGNGSASDERLFEIPAFLVDRYAVTNADFQRFVEAGGYEDGNLWEPNAWPAVVDFVDQSRNFGPRFWTDGRAPRDLLDHPVVGVCWYEAAAYARWVGKRLPSDAEWVKAAAWPINTAGAKPIQRRFPWGDVMDRRLANLWGSRGNTTAPVTEYPDGANGAGAHQLIGNVWEWTDGDFGALDLPIDRLETETPFKSLRGGAFDTYFESQATAQFQSGDSPLARKPNIGFRCAISCDAVLAFESTATA